MIKWQELIDIQLFKECSEGDLNELTRYIEKVFVKENRFVYSAADPSNYLYIIQKGEVELLLPLDNGKLTTSSVLRDRDVFGIGEIFFDTYYLNAHTLSKVELLRISKKNFFTHFIPINEIALNTLHDFANIVKMAATQKKWDQSRDTVLLYLISYCKKNGQDLFDRYIVNFKKTHDEIGHVLNISREHVSRIFGELKKEEIMTLKKSTLILIKERIPEIIKSNDIAEFMKF